MDNLTSTATIRSPDNLQGITLQCSDVAGSTETSTFNVEPGNDPCCVCACANTVNSTKLHVCICYDSPYVGITRTL